MLTVRRVRIVIPTPNSTLAIVPRYEEPLLRIKFAAQIPQLQLQVTVSELPEHMRVPSIQWHHFPSIDFEINRLANHYRGVIDRFGTPALQSAFPDGARFVIMQEVEATEKLLEAAAENIEAPEELVDISIPKELAKVLAASGWGSLAHLAAANPEDIAALDGVRLTQARRYVAAAKKKILAGMPQVEEPFGAKSTQAPLVAEDARPLMERGNATTSAPQGLTQALKGR